MIDDITIIFNKCHSHENINKDLLQYSVLFVGSVSVSLLLVLIDLV